MSYIVKFSPFNPIQFVPKDMIVPDDGGYPAFGTALYVDTLKPWHVQAPYYQPVLRDQFICLQAKATWVDNTGNFTTISVIDISTGAIVQTIGASSFAVLPGDIDEETGEQLHAQQYLFKMSDYDPLDNIELVQLKYLMHFNDGTELYYLSNPISIRDKHIGHSLLEYNNSFNKSNTIFEQLKPRYQYLFPSNGLVWEPGGEYTVFNDQEEELTQLYGKAFNTFSLDIGGMHGIPEYQTAIMNYILKECDLIRIGGRQYTPEDNSLERAGNAGKHVQWRIAKLRQANEDDNTTFNNRQIKVWERPASGYPYAIIRTYIFDNFIYQGIHDDDVKVFDDSAAETSFLAALNSAAVLNGQTGSWEEVGGVFYYINGTGETFKAGAGQYIFTKTLTLSVHVNSVTQVFKYTLGFPTTGPWFPHVVSWGATSGDDVLYWNNTATASTTVTRGLAPGDHTIRIIHRDDITEFSCSGTGQILGAHGKIRNITGVLSAVQANCYLFNHDFNALTELDLAFLAPAKNTLQFLTIEKSRLKRVKSGWASGLISGSYKPYFKLGYVRIYQNQLTTTDVNDFLVEFHDDKQDINGSLIDLSHNLPAAPPSGAGTTAKTDLINNHFCSVTTD